MRASVFQGVHFIAMGGEADQGAPSHPVNDMIVYDVAPLDPDDASSDQDKVVTDEELTEVEGWALSQAELYANGDVPQSQR